MKTLPRMKSLMGNRREFIRTLKYFDKVQSWTLILIDYPRTKERKELVFIYPAHEEPRPDTLAETVRRLKKDSHVDIEVLSKKELFQWMKRDANSP